MNEPFYLFARALAGVAEELMKALLYAFDRMGRRRFHA